MQVPVFSRSDVVQDGIPPCRIRTDAARTEISPYSFPNIYCNTHPPRRPAPESDQVYVPKTISPLRTPFQYMCGNIYHDPVPASDRKL